MFLVFGKNVVLVNICCSDHRMILHDVIDKSSLIICEIRPGAVVSGRRVAIGMFFKNGFPPFIFPYQIAYNFNKAIVSQKWTIRYSS